MEVFRLLFFKYKQGTSGDSSLHFLLFFSLALATANYILHMYICLHLEAFTFRLQFSYLLYCFAPFSGFPTCMLWLHTLLPIFTNNFSHIHRISSITRTYICMYVCLCILSHTSSHHIKRSTLAHSQIFCLLDIAAESCLATMIHCKVAPLAKFTASLVADAGSAIIVAGKKSVSFLCLFTSLLFGWQRVQLHLSCSLNELFSMVCWGV